MRPNINSPDYMPQKISEIEMKRTLGLAIASSLKLWEAFQDEENTSDLIFKTQKELEQAAKLLKKYQIVTSKI